MTFRCNARSVKFPAPGPYNQHIAACMGSPEGIRNYQALGAVDHAVDLTVGEEEWSLLANSFTNFPPVPNLTKSTTIMPILLKAKLGKIEIDEAAQSIAVEVPQDLALALDRERLEHLMSRYIWLIYGKNPKAEIEEVGQYRMDGRRRTGMVAMEFLPQKT